MGADQPRNGFVEPEPPAPPVRSTTLDAERAACLALPPLSASLLDATVTVRRYDPSAAEPLSGDGPELTFTAVDVEVWATAALELIDRTLAPERVAVARTLAGSAGPLARLEDARAALAAAISATAVPILAEDASRTDRGAASAAFERALRSGLGARRDAVAVVQVPTTMDASAANTDVLAGTPARPGTAGADAASGTFDLVVGAADPERRRHLPLALDVAVTVDAATTPGPRVLALGPWKLPVDVPVALRPLPAPPRAVAADAIASVDGDRDPTVAELATWTSVATFAAPTADQDELGLRVGWNVAPPAVPPPPVAAEDAARPSVRGVGTDLLAALADLVTNQPAIEADLDLLVPEPKPDPDPADPSATDSEDPAVPDPVPAPDDSSVLDPFARALSALTALGSVAERMAAGWGPVATDGPGADVDLGTHAVAQLQLAVVSGSASDGTRTVEAFVLRRARGTGWGPQDRRPQLGHGPAGAALTVLDASPSDDDPDVLRYVPSPALAPGDDPWTVALVYPGLHVVTTQSTRVAARTTRNGVLLEGRPTNVAFITRSPEMATELAVPGLVHDTPVAIGGGRLADFPAALGAAFADLLGADPQGRYRAALTLKYVYRTDDVESGGPGLDIVLPVATLPDRDDLVGVPEELAATASAWLGEQAPTGAADPRLSVELRVFPPATGSGAPLLTLSRLDYVLTS